MKRQNAILFFLLLSILAPPASRFFAPRAHLTAQNTTVLHPRSRGPRVLTIFPKWNVLPADRYRPCASIAASKRLPRRSQVDGRRSGERGKRDKVGTAQVFGEIDLGRSSNRTVRPPRISLTDADAPRFRHVNISRKAKRKEKREEKKEKVLIYSRRIIPYNFVRRQNYSFTLLS